ncbi:MAG: UbiA family prenyltransferase [Geminicoccaceae bacterium]|nr:UbiA family prenyltransferase [Geminicoccaceae bacterium]
MTAAASATSPCASAAAEAPLLVPLEDALLRTDLRLEAALSLLRRAPLALLRWLASPGREPIVARARAEGAGPEPSLLPLEPALVAYLFDQHARGRRLILSVREDLASGRAIADRLGIFEAVREANAESDVAEGARFALVVRSKVDDPRARSANGLVVLGSRPPARTRSPVEALLPVEKAGLRRWLEALRLHQWTKNLLVFLPVVLAGPLSGVSDWVRALVAFLVVGLLASAGYLVNDLLDLDADRRHESKCTRPFASGALPLAAGIASVPILVGLAAASSTLLPSRFALAAGSYFFANLAYSFWLKHVAFLDVISLGGLFTVRVIAGAFAIAAPVSYWLLTFSMFLFLSLAVLKRYAELDQLARRGGTELVDRGYSTLDLPLLVSLGVASGVASTVIFVVYLVTEHFPRALYSRPGWLWLAFPVLLYWLVRAWRLAVHGRMNEDPVLFALRDPVSRAMVVMVLGVLFLAW